jgi:hypothetical protein
MAALVGVVCAAAWQPLPFLLAGIVTAIACGLVPLLVRERATSPDGPGQHWTRLGPGADRLATIASSVDS